MAKVPCTTLSHPTQQPRGVRGSRQGDPMTTRHLSQNPFFVQICDAKNAQCHSLGKHNIENYFNREISEKYFISIWWKCLHYEHDLVF